jgi:serine O-acetyltransferase
MDLSQWHDGLGAGAYIRHLFFDSGYFAVICYRLARYFMYKEFPPFGKKIPFMSSFFRRLAVSKSGCDIFPSAEIGEGLFINHSPGIVIGAGVKIGRKLRIFSGVTLGARDLKEHESVSAVRYPVIGDEVVIFSGAKIIGGVTIGDGATIGANAVVVDSVPPGATAVGVPARVVSGGG